MRWSIALASVLLLGSVASASAVDNDRFEGKGDQVEGSVKKGAGEVTGNERLQSEGSSQKSKGKIEEGWGKTKDAARDAGDAIKEKLK
ncbi:MAG TPA: CsbD family protein [Stellaceae bacterium]|nr:CsbD family protein [Stellaceae bacterium]